MDDIWLGRIRNGCLADRIQILGIEADEDTMTEAQSFLKSVAKLHNANSEFPERPSWAQGAFVYVSQSQAKELETVVMKLGLRFKPHEIVVSHDYVEKVKEVMGSWHGPGRKGYRKHRNSTCSWERLVDTSKFLRAAHIASVLDGFPQVDSEVAQWLFCLMILRLLKSSAALEEQCGSEVQSPTPEVVADLSSRSEIFAETLLCAAVQCVAHQGTPHRKPAAYSWTNCLVHHKLFWQRFSQTDCSESMGRVSRSHQLRTALKLCTDAVLSLLTNASVAAIHFLDDRDLLCVARSHRASIPPSRVLQRYRLGEGVAGWSAEHGEPVCLSDTSADARFVSRSSQNHTVRSLLVVPIAYSKQVIGVIGATSTDGDAFQQTDMENMLQLVDSLAFYLNQARLPSLTQLSENKHVGMQDLIGRLDGGSDVVLRAMQRLFG